MVSLNLLVSVTAFNSSAMVVSGGGGGGGGEGGGGAVLDLFSPSHHHTHTHTHTHIHLYMYMYVRMYTYISRNPGPNLVHTCMHIHVQLKGNMHELEACALYVHYVPAHTNAL